MKHSDPKFNQSLRELILDYIYKTATAKLDKELNTIMESNYISNSSMSFMYKGNVYCPEGYRPVKRIGLLPKRLYEYMEKWLKDKKEIEQERQQVNNFVSTILLSSSDLREVMALLPDCLHPALTTKTVPASLPEEEIRAFHALNNSIIQTIKQRLLLNLII